MTPEQFIQRLEAEIKPYAAKIAEIDRDHGYACNKVWFQKKIDELEAAIRKVREWNPPQRDGGGP